MSVDYGTSAGGTARRSLLPTLALTFAAFVLGLAAMAWILARWSSAAALIGVNPAVPVEPQAPHSAAPVPAQTLIAEPRTGNEAQRFIIDPETIRRVTELEQRVGLLDRQSRAALGNADRAEGLLVAFAARRALDRGVPLGYIEGLLSQRFGETQRQAVATIITASRQPVTLQELQLDLQEVGPELAGAGPNQNWWTAFKSELGGLVTLRKAGTPSSMPEERFRRATQRLEAGQVEVALAEVLRMPGRQSARQWVEDARRYVAARRALDTIETAALLESNVRAAPAAVAGRQDPPLS